MNCEELRTLVGAEPNSTSPEVLAHIASCPECARYRQELQAMDRLIYRALAVDAPAVTVASQPKPKQRPARMWRMAASVLITVLVGAMSLWLLTPRESFAAEAIAHVKHEQFSIVQTSETVDDKDLAAVLAASRLRLKPGAARVSYAQSCPFRGQRVPHLVVQTEQGPVTALVVTDAPTQAREHIDEQGFQGEIIPAPRGVIVVLGKNVPVDAAAKTLLSALEY
jgi:anti-sigma factor RsiW